jgi:hypothetical protein
MLPASRSQHFEFQMPTAIAASIPSRRSQRPYRMTTSIGWSFPYPDSSILGMINPNRAGAFNSGQK